jgi:hypothetical protein
MFTKLLENKMARYVSTGLQSNVGIKQFYTPSASPESCAGCQNEKLVSIKEAIELCARWAAEKSL